MFTNENQRQEKIQEIKSALKTEKEPYLRKRYEVILMLLEGSSYEQIADQIEIAQSSIPNYRKAYLRDGLDGLKRKKNLGRRNYLTPLQEVEVMELLQFIPPDSAGFEGQKKWTASLLQKWLMDQFDVHFSKTGVLKLIHRLNFVYDEKEQKYNYQFFLYNEEKNDKKTKTRRD